MKRIELEYIQQALREIGDLQCMGCLFDQVLTLPFSIVLNTRIENKYTFHTSLMLYAAQLFLSPDRPFVLQFGHLFVKMFVGIPEGFSRPVNYLSIW